MTWLSDTVNKFLHFAIFDDVKWESILLSDYHMKPADTAHASPYFQLHAYSLPIPSNEWNGALDWLHG